jgi:hypothetical protein
MADLTSSVGQSRPRVPCRGAGTAIVALVISLLPATAAAQRAAPSGSDENIAASITPCVWITGFGGAIGVIDQTATVSTGVFDAIADANIAACAAAEVRAGPAAILLDFSAGNLTDPNAIPGSASNLPNVHAELRSVQLDAFIGYRIVESDRLDLDVFGGVRITHFGPTLTEGAAAAAQIFTATDTWGDLVGGLRITARPNPQWWLSAKGDLGGEVPDEFGSSRSWQAAVEVGRKLSRRLSIVAGYRVVHLRRDSNDLHFDGNERGLRIGFRLAGPDFR